MKRQSALRLEGPRQGPPGSVPRFAAATYEALVQMFPAWSFALDADHRLIQVGDNVQRVEGVAPDDLIGQSVLASLHGVHSGEVGLEDYHQALKNHQPITGLTYERRMLDGDRAVLMEAAVPRFDDAGQFEGYDGITLNLTQTFKIADQTVSLVSDLQTRARELETALQDRNLELEQSNKILRDVLEAMGEGLLVTTGSGLDDPENRILFANPAYCRLYSLEEGDVTPGMTLGELSEKFIAEGKIVVDLEPEEVADRIAKSLPLKARNLETDSTIMATATHRPGGGQVIVNTDITELSERAKGLEEARKQADSANEAKSRFLASMSHEIRTPMNGIVGMADLLAGTDLTKDQAESVETIRSSALALTRLISDILDFSKVEAGQMTLEENDFSLRDLCEEVAALMIPMAEVQDLQFVLDLDPALPAYKRGDSIRLRQVLVNLLGNAIKFTMSGSVTLRVRAGTPAVIEVADTGIGIPQDMLDKIFNPFEQAQGGLQRQFEGSGLGLAITQKLVVAMGGEIAVESKEGEGTVFKVSLPLPEGQAPLATQARVGRKSHDSLPETTVLVAEDNRTNQMVIQKMLARLNATAVIAGDGRAAVEAFLAGKFDAVLMDLSMPRLNGLDATRILRQSEKDRRVAPTPVIALTGNAFAQDREAAMAAGMDDFLTKPLRLEELQQCLARHLPDAVGHST